MNPLGRDATQSFRDFAGIVDDRLHAPVNHHAYAACTGGSFHRKLSTLPTEKLETLLIVRRDLSLCLETLRAMRKAGRKVAIILKECGLAQIAQLIAKPSMLRLFESLCREADGCVSGTPHAVPILRAAGAKTVEFIPAPYPVEEPQWDFSLPAEERRGIFIGTREFKIASRNHLAAMLCARALHTETSEPVTVLNEDHRAGRRLLESLDFPPSSLRVLDGPLPYSRYLRLMASHKLVFQLDRSAVPGQVAGDALLCRIPCVGGDSAMESVVFPSVAGAGREPSDAMDSARRLLSSPQDYRDVVSQAQTVAKQCVSFSRIRAALEDFYAVI